MWHIFMLKQTTGLGCFINRVYLVLCLMSNQRSSSPEDNVLKVSFCDGQFSAVYRPCVRMSMRASTISLINFSFLTTSPNLSLLYQKLFKELNSMKNSSCHGNREICFNFYKSSCQKPRCL